MSASQTSAPQATIEAPADVPVIRTTRDFAATPEQLIRAHTDPELFAQWVGPDGMETEVLSWNGTTGGNWRYVARRGDEEYRFHGSFHDVLPDRIVQTFTYDEFPTAVTLETLTFEDLGDGRTRLHGVSVWESFQDRDGMVASGMEHGVNDGYAKLDTMLADGAL